MMSVGVRGIQQYLVVCVKAEWRYGTSPSVCKESLATVHVTWLSFI